MFIGTPISSALARGRLDYGLRGAQGHTIRHVSSFDAVFGRVEASAGARRCRLAPGVAGGLQSCSSADFGVEPVRVSLQHRPQDASQARHLRSNRHRLAAGPVELVRELPAVSPSGWAASRATISPCRGLSSKGSPAELDHGPLRARAPRPRAWASGDAPHAARRRIRIASAAPRRSARPAPAPPSAASTPPPSGAGSGTRAIHGARRRVPARPGSPSAVRSRTPRATRSR